MIKRINYFFQAIIIYFFFLIGGILGLNLSRSFFSFLFCSFGPLFRSKKIINKNLEIFSNNVSPINKDEIINNMWKNYGMTFIEYIYLKNFRETANEINIKNKENLNKLVIQNKPVIFISGHFANFELMSMIITHNNINLATIYRPLNNFFVNPFMEYLRKKYVCKNQIKKGIYGLREAVEYIKKNHSIALMIDQRLGEGENVNFFGKPALTTTLPAQLAIKYKLKIVPVFIKRLKNNKFEIDFQKEIEPAEFKDKLEITEKLNKILEKMITQNPDQWIWSHNRWKQ